MHCVSSQRIFYKVEIYHLVKTVDMSFFMKNAGLLSCVNAIVLFIRYNDNILQRCPAQMHQTSYVDSALI